MQPLAYARPCIHNINMNQKHIDLLARNYISLREAYRSAQTAGKEEFTWGTDKITNVDFNTKYAYYLLQFIKPTAVAYEGSTIKQQDIRTDEF